jgi:hypothetical protein
MDSKDAVLIDTEVSHIYPITKDLSSGKEENFEGHLLLGSGCWCHPVIEIREGVVYVVHTRRILNAYKDVEKERTIMG